MPIHCSATPIETSVDSVARRVQSLGREIVTGRSGTVRSTIELAIHAVAASIEMILYSVAARIEAVLDTIATPIGPFCGSSPSLRRTQQRAERDHEYPGFHGSPPWRDLLNTP